MGSLWPRGQNAQSNAARMGARAAIRIQDFLFIFVAWVVCVEDTGHFGGVQWCENGEVAVSREGRHLAGCLCCGLSGLPNFFSKNLAVRHFNQGA